VLVGGGQGGVFVVEGGETRSSFAMFALLCFFYIFFFALTEFPKENFCYFLLKAQLTRAEFAVLGFFLVYIIPRKREGGKERQGETEMFLL
jgi:hypothetical protein